jgi:hypothetical protein
MPEQPFSPALIADAETPAFSRPVVGSLVGVAEGA